MPSIFTRIIDGELPGRFVWRDERCVAFLSIAPLRPGHTLVVPIEEVDHWIDLAPPSPAGVVTLTRIEMTPDAERFVYSYPRFLTNLYTVTGLH